MQLTLPDVLTHRGTEDHTFSAEVIVQNDASEWVSICTITEISFVGSEDTGISGEPVRVFPPTADPDLTKTVNLLELADIVDLVVLTTVPFDFYNRVIFSFERVPESGITSIVSSPDLADAFSKEKRTRL